MLTEKNSMGRSHNKWLFGSFVFVCVFYGSEMSARQKQQPIVADSEQSKSMVSLQGWSLIDWGWKCSQNGWSIKRFPHTSAREVNFRAYRVGQNPSSDSKSNRIKDQGEAAVSYKWTGWSWRLQKNYRSFRGIYRIKYPNSIKENWRMLTCNRLNLQTLGSQPVIMSKNLPNCWSGYMLTSSSLDAFIYLRNIPLDWTGKSPEVLNVNRLFLELNWFICN